MAGVTPTAEEKAEALIYARKFANRLVYRALRCRGIDRARQVQYAEEMLAEIMVIVSRALEKYKPNTSNATLATYVCRAVVYNVARSWKAVHPIGRGWVDPQTGDFKNHARTMSLYDPRFHDGRGQGDAEDCNGFAIPEPATRPEQLIEAEDGWGRVLSVLNPLLRETCRLHFREGMTFAEIGRLQGRSDESIRCRVERSLLTIRKSPRAMRILTEWRESSH